MRVLLLATMLSVVACAHPTEPVLVEDFSILELHATPVPVDLLARPAIDQMRQRFDDLSMLEGWLVAGRLDEASTLAAMLARAAHHSDERLDVATMMVQNAPSLDLALRAAPMIDAACAACHERSHARVTFPFRGVPRTRLARHEWAIDRLREGLVGPDAARWQAALEILAAEPVVDGTALPFGSAAGRAQAPAGDVRWAHWIAASRLQTLAVAALVEPPPSCDERMTVYRDLLSTCAGCHTTRR